MENGGWIVLLILIVLVGGVNLIAYAAARGAFRGGDQGSLFGVINNAIQTAQKKDGGELEELRRRLEELEKGKKE